MSTAVQVQPDPGRRGIDWPAAAAGPQAPAMTTAMTTAMTAAAAGADAREWRVLPFRGGVYRGEAVRAAPAAEWLPCGHGAWTRVADGQRVLGCWSPSAAADAMRCCGLWQRPGLSLEGDWLVDERASDSAAEDEHGAIRSSFSGVGVGAFALGGVFTGAWSASAPCGLGKLVRFGPDGQVASTRGWTRGLECVQPCASAVSGGDDTPRRLRDARRELPEQPERGLSVAASRLERWRTDALAGAMTRWRRCVCRQSVRMARAARLDALRARSLALEAEARAVRQDVERQRAQARSEREDMSALMAQSRAASLRRRRTRERADTRRHEAAERLELARVCVERQREAADAVERELVAVMEQLAAARQAQTDCHAAAHELRTLKRQIENVSVQVDALRQRVRLAASAGAGASDFATAVEKPPSRPTTAPELQRPAIAGATLSAVDVLAAGAEDAGSTNVCDVPGCGCGIPRDVFLRIASAINDEQ